MISKIIIVCYKMIIKSQFTHLNSYKRDGIPCTMKAHALLMHVVLCLRLFREYEEVT